MPSPTVGRGGSPAKAGAKPPEISPPVGANPLRQPRVDQLPLVSDIDTIDDVGERAVIFPSTAGTLRDPNNFGKEWRRAREELGVPEVTTHSFRKTVATLIDDDGLSARIGADHLGHSKVPMTQDRYMTRGRVHAQVADLLDRTVAKSGE
jgi:integrase